MVLNIGTSYGNTKKSHGLRQSINLLRIMNELQGIITPQEVINIKGKIVVTLTKTVNLQDATMEQLIDDAYENLYEFIKNGDPEMEVFGRVVRS